MDLESADIEHYSRQMLLFGRNGQYRLKNSSIVIVGAGGIGSTCILYLAGGGVGNIHIIDDDQVEINNLHRQIIFKYDNQGTSKAKTAMEAAIGLNPDINVTYNQLRIDTSNVESLIERHSIVIDCSDNMATRYILNDACVLKHKILLSGSAIGWDGQATVFPNIQLPSSSSSLNISKEVMNLTKVACYRCLYPNPTRNNTSASCNSIGVLGPVPGVIGSILAAEACKIVISGLPSLNEATTSADTNNINNSKSNNTGNSNKKDSDLSFSPEIPVAVGKQLYYDCFGSNFMTFTLPRKRDNCLVCGHITSNNHTNTSSSEFALIKSPADTLTWLQSVGALGVCTNSSNNNSSDSSSFDSSVFKSMNVKEFHSLLKANETNAISNLPPSSASLASYVSACVLIDVRPEKEFEMVSLAHYFDQINRCTLSHSTFLRLYEQNKEDCISNGSEHESSSKSNLLYVNIPYPTMKDEKISRNLHRLLLSKTSESKLTVMCLCRRGISSRLASVEVYNSINDMKKEMESVHIEVDVVNVNGGLEAYRLVNKQFPKY